ncbi:MAG: hypothetical protein IJ525_00445 [Alphaproteobacteria bacterium]|nr:hypothetical protein [Alphaproteobacteria bacterium]
MPQLDFATYLSQAFWLIVCFCFLWAVLANFITPKIADIQEQRKRKIDDFIQKADKLNKQAQKSLDKYNNALNEAKNVAEKQIEAGKSELKNYLDEAERKSAIKLGKKIADSELLVAKEKKETMQQIEIIAQDLSFDIVQKLGFSHISKQDIANISKKR